MTFTEAYSYATTLCSKQERCSSYIIEKLQKNGADEAVISSVIERLSKERYLDDLRYATFFARDKYRFDKWGRIKILYHLKLKKIDSEAIESALKSIDDEIYSTNLRQLIELAKRRSKETNAYKRDSKIAQMMASKGYESKLIFSILKNPEITEPYED